MRVTGETYMRDTVLVCQLKNNSVLFCRFSALPNSAEFCRILQKLKSFPLSFLGQLESNELELEMNELESCSKKSYNSDTLHQ